MRIDVLTLFPEVFAPVIHTSILKRAISKGVVGIYAHNLRDWSRDKHKKVDDRPYGGGPGMVMRPEPFFDAVDDLKKQYLRGSDPKRRGQTPSAFQSPESLPLQPHVILLSPQGERLTQAKVEALAQRPWLILLCGHYEGVDDRVRLALADEEISIGDYVLTCGELPAMVLIDSVVRLLPGSLGDPGSCKEESFSKGLLEYPQYTRPSTFRGIEVPEILRSGNAAQIANWRKLQALRRTFARRTDLGP